jgi:hypothetical protein
MYTTSPGLKMEGLIQIPAAFFLLGYVSSSSTPQRLIKAAFARLAG